LKAFYQFLIGSNLTVCHSHRPYASRSYEHKLHSVHIKHASAHIDTSALFCMQIELDWIVQCFTSPPTQYRLYGRRVQIEYWIFTCKVLDQMPAISAYSAIFPPSSAAM